MLNRWRSNAHQCYIKTPPQELAKPSTQLSTPNDSSHNYCCITLVIVTVSFPKIIIQSVTISSWRAHPWNVPSTNTYNTWVKAGWRIRFAFLGLSWKIFGGTEPVLLQTSFFPKYCKRLLLFGHCLGKYIVLNPKVVEALYTYKTTSIINWLCEAPKEELQPDMQDTLSRC